MVSDSPEDIIAHFICINRVKGVFEEAMWQVIGLVNQDCKDLIQLSGMARNVLFLVVLTVDQYSKI